MNAEWQKLRENAKGLRRKVWTGTKFLKPNISYFVQILRFVVIYAFYQAFGNTQKQRISKYTLAERIEGIFAFAESLSTSATLNK